MKITPEDYQYLKEEMAKFLATTPEEEAIGYAKWIKERGDYKDFRERILFDMFAFVNRKNDFAISSLFYSKDYNDDHIYTALKALEKEFSILERMVRV